MRGLLPEEYTIGDRQLYNVYNNMFNIHTLCSDRYRGTYRLVSTDHASVRIAVFVLTSRHVQGTYRDTYSSRYRLVRTNTAIRTRVGNGVRTE